MILKEPGNLPAVFSAKNVPSAMPTTLARDFEMSLAGDLAPERSTL